MLCSVFPHLGGHTIVCHRMHMLFSVNPPYLRPVVMNNHLTSVCIFLSPGFFPSANLISNTRTVHCIDFNTVSCEELKNFEISYRFRIDRTGETSWRFCKKRILYSLLCFNANLKSYFNMNIALISRIVAKNCLLCRNCLLCCSHYARIRVLVRS
jgi:hypothetical protein